MLGDFGRSCLWHFSGGSATNADVNRWRCAAGVCLAISSLPGSSHGEPAPDRATRLRLVWQAPEGCPSASEVVAEIERLVTVPIDSLLQTLLSVNAVVATIPAGFKLTLTTSVAGEPRSRELSAPTCTELTGAAALVIALTIDPELFTKPPPTAALGDVGPSPGSPTPAPVVVAQPSASAGVPPGPPPPRVPERQSPDTTFVTGLGLSATIGIWPSPVTGPILLGAVEHRSVRAELGLGTSSGDWQSDKTGGAASSRSYIAAPRGCWLATGSTLGVGPCAGLEIGALHGQGAGVAQKHSATLLWVAPSLGGVARWRVRQNAELVLEADALKPLVPNGFSLAGQPIYRFRDKSLAASLGVSLGVVWP
jgi:hypothetical protein